jgi:hypothetical protein
VELNVAEKLRHLPSDDSAEAAPSPTIANSQAPTPAIADLPVWRQSAMRMKPSDPAVAKEMGSVPASELNLEWIYGYGAQVGGKTERGKERGAGGLCLCVLVVNVSWCWSDVLACAVCVVIQASNENCDSMNLGGVQESRSNLFYSASGDIIYHAATAGIVYKKVRLCYTS